MEERRPRKRRPRPGFVLNAVCLIVILICFAIGGIQSVAARHQAEKQAAAEAAALQAQQEEERRLAEEQAAALEASKYDFTFSFMGDLNLADDWSPMQHLKARENGIEDCIGPELLQLMRDADLFCVNNEFAFTTRGQALAGKRWTIHGDPANVSILEEMGVDLVTLANNHIYDMGPDGLTDTLTTLDGAGILRVGAGENIEDASAPVYVERQGVTVGFVDACNAEHTRYTPEATEDSSGVLLCYEYDKFLSSVREAKENADFVIAMVHWGTDYVYETSDGQRDLGHQLIDAGADVVIVAHSHCIQGIEYYNNCPIFYGLGTCWFNNKTLATYMLQLHFQGDMNGGTITSTVLPGMQDNWVTRLAPTEEEATSTTDLILQYSNGVYFERDTDSELYAYVLHEGQAPAAEASPEDAGTDDAAPESEPDLGETGEA